MRGLPASDVTGRLGTLSQWVTVRFACQQCDCAVYQPAVADRFAVDVLSRLNGAPRRSAKHDMTAVRVATAKSIHTKCFMWKRLMFDVYESGADVANRCDYCVVIQSAVAIVVTI